MLLNNYNKNIIILAKKSYTAYIVPMLIFAFTIFIGLNANILVTLFIILPIGIATFLHIKSITLFVDENGVWVYEGILPWNRGYYVKGG